MGYDLEDAGGMGSRDDMIALFVSSAVNDNAIRSIDYKL